MPALAPISANVPARVPLGKEDGAVVASTAATAAATAAAAGAKRKQKASALCYTPPAMINDRKRDRSYFRRGLLGEGGFARCFEVTDFQGTRLAAKCIAKKSITSEKVKMKLLGEIKVHKSMDHPNIVKQRDCFEDDVNVYMILDICTQGTLMEMLKQRKRFSEPEVRFFGLQILGAAKYMHSRRVIHRDLKLGNLFLDEAMNIKVGDFGLAALLVDDDDRKKTICGTPNYIAPEVLFGSAEGHSYEVDLWSIGVIFYAMLVGKPPFQSKEVKAIYAKIKVNEYDFPEEAKVSQVAQGLIRSLLATDPENRPSIDDIANHAFFNTGVMPRQIPPSATHEAPSWPAGQSSSVFRRNLNHVCFNAGIGKENIAGKEYGQLADSVVERPEQGRYLPVSLSPHTGPAAKMVHGHARRPGATSQGQVSGKLADRLQAVKMGEVPRPPPVPPKSKEEMAAHQAQIDQLRERRQSTMLTGAVRPAIVRGPASAPGMEHVAEQPRLRGAVRAVEGPAPITRSSRFASLQATSQPSAPLHPVQDVSQEPLRLRTRAARRALTQPAVQAVAVVPSSSSSRQASREASPRPVAALSRQASTRTYSTTSSSSLAAAAAVQAKTLTQSLLTLSRRLLETAALSGTARAGLQASMEEDGRFLYVSKWVDYSHRYGLGYQLSNGTTGVSFNDGTTIIQHDTQQSSSFEFLPASEGSQAVQPEAYTMTQVPEHLRKKVSLLKHFRGYMTAHLNSAANSTPVTGTQQTVYKDLCTMTHYLRCKAGILFRLRDGTIQVNFQDHAKLILSPHAGYEDAHVRHLDCDKRMFQYPSLAEAGRSGGDACRAKLASFGRILQESAQDLH
ncbi:kinase-like domain-containing protein [Protomyces lactucae-debilis]|uniref:Serine/threonine-protein kinase n=1 Tax=Protomyces lactucae-debilis TaxID=2754530 RepID=A0A1Y2FNY6_PROLT|nr:kinase-like domain-containing protein [Protomyces lactucae-debilis]ORY85688.1 kinase-like domain-containing protein [Protomyces lactucae-debilis]